MKATVTWTGNYTFVGQTESGHAIAFGAPKGDAPKPGPSPMELLLLGAGGCSAVDVVGILEKSREAIEGCEVRLTSERAATDPKVFTSIHMTFVVRGRNLNLAKVERAVALSAEKYCSASIMLAKTATLTHSVELIETGT